MFPWTSFSKVKGQGKHPSGSGKGQDEEAGGQEVGDEVVVWVQEEREKPELGLAETARSVEKIQGGR